ncbi:hypothetical protein DN38_3272 [Vibrio cholerae]|nr:hypothetical protein DN38_3272 [Vibrio cholerae]
MVHRFAEGSLNIWRKSSEDIWVVTRSWLGSISRRASSARRV